MTSTDREGGSSIVLCDEPEIVGTVVIPLDILDDLFKVAEK